MGENGIFYVNSYGALTAKQHRNNRALEESGIIYFENALSDYLTNNKGKQKLVPIINGSSNFLIEVKDNHIKGYLNTLNIQAKDLENKVKNAMPALNEAKSNKDNIEKKLYIELGVLENKISDMLKTQIDMLCSQIPNYVDEMNLDNHMTINPFKQKERKKALENEVINQLNQFVENKMAEWSNTELKKYIDVFINDLQRQIGRDIEKFYSNLDRFRFEVSGVESNKNISLFSRVTSTILGTFIGGPTYAMVGATMGFGEMLKRSITSFTWAILVAAFIPGLSDLALIAYLTSGLVHVATGGKSLTKKYKDALKNEFIKKMKNEKDEICKKYASQVRENVSEKFDLISQALEKEIKVEESKINAARADQKKIWPIRLKRRLH
ncbi:MAG: hypothetical protein LUD77_07980 [Clostridiales bacterium]|nr:hypothetical protein [Clostridiales bacterium]